MKKIIDIPKIICGEAIYPSVDTESICIEYASGTTLRIPKVTDADFELIVSNRQLLDNIPVSEVTTFLQRGGSHFANLDNALTAEASALCCDITGFSRQMVERDYKLMGSYLFHRNVLYDLLDAELGDHRIMDEWIRRQVARVRAFPRGRVFHVVAGNVPLSSMYSLVRSLLTKNHTVIKLPSRDMISCLYFARALIANNGLNHPLSKSISVVYCDEKDCMIDRLIESSDLVCAWGQATSLLNIKKKVPQGIPMLEFGPKRSLSLIYANECHKDKAAMRIAHDVAVYDQEACFSPQRLFVIGDYGVLLDAIHKWLDIQENFYPKGKITQDANSHVFRTQLEAIYRGCEVKSGASWTIIVSKNPLDMLEHPLSRTLYVHPIESISEIVPFVDEETQSISLYPYTDHVEELGNLLCARGVVRICEAGMISHFRQGFTHDGAYPLQQFVRLAYLDESLEYVYKYGNPTVEQYEVRLFGAQSFESEV